MKMKKLFYVLPALGIAFTLASCGEGSASIEYTDSEGNTQKIDVKPTENSEDIADVLYALASKDISKPEEITMNLSANADLQATRVSTNETAKLSGSLDSTLQLAIDTKAKTGDDLINSVQAYASVKAKASLPFDYITSEGKSGSLTKNDKVELDLEAFFDTKVAYAYINKLSIPELDASTEQGEMINALIPQLTSTVFKYDLSDMIDAEVIANIEEEVLPALGLDFSILSFIATTDAPSKDEFKEAAAQYIDMLGLSIKSVTGSTIVFKAEFNPAAFEDDDEEVTVNENINLEFAVDANKVLPKYIKVDAAAYLKAFGEASPDTKDVKVSKLNCELNFKYDEKVKTISAAKKDAAEDISALIEALMGGPLTPTLA